MSKKLNLLSSVAFVALVASASTTLAQTVTVEGNIVQNANNQNTVTNTGNANLGGLLNGIGAQGSVAASGALAGVTVTTLGTTAPSVTVEGFIQQDATNNQRITNKPIVGGSNIKTGEVVGDGTSLSATASGANAVVGVTTVKGESPSPAVTVEKYIKQTSTNSSSATISNGTKSDPVRIKTTTAGVTGHGASLGVSASGATSAVGYTTINTTADGSTKVEVKGNIDQTTYNYGHTRNYGQINVNGDIFGAGASVSVSATGAASIVGVTSITGASEDGKAPKSIETSRIIQGTLNDGNANVINRGTITAHKVTGHGASLSVSASGANSAVVYTSISNKNIANPSLITESIDQNTTNTKSVSNTGTINVATISGAGASASISASGATSAIGVTSINDWKTASVSTGPISQTTVNTGLVTNSGTITVGSTGVSGTGLSVSIGASGATAVASVSYMK